AGRHAVHLPCDRPRSHVVIAWIGERRDTDVTRRIADTHPGNPMVPRSDLAVPPQASPHLPGWPSLAGPSAPPRWPLAVVLAVFLFLLCPLPGDDGNFPLWSPAIGVGLALVAWFGRRFALTTMAAAAALAVLRQAARPATWQGGEIRLLWVALEGAVAV